MAFVLRKVDRGLILHLELEGYVRLSPGLVPCKKIAVDGRLAPSRSGAPPQNVLWQALPAAALLSRSPFPFVLSLSKGDSDRFPSLPSRSRALCSIGLFAGSACCAVQTETDVRQGILSQPGRIQKAIAGCTLVPTTGYITGHDDG